MLSTAFAFLVAAAGWYYLFHTRGAQRLKNVEGNRLNAQRIRCRRIGGLMMLLLGFCFYAMFRSLDNGSSPQAFVVLFLTVCVLLLLVVVLAIVDLRLTWRIRLPPKL